MVFPCFLGDIVEGGIHSKCFTVGLVPIFSQIMKMKYLFAVLLLSLPLLALAHTQDDVLSLSNVSSLLFQKGQFTTNRPVPHSELECTGQNCGQVNISKVLCEKKGKKTWHCIPQGLRLNVNVNLKNTQVVCEGYANATDALVLRGSCYLQYEIDSTPPSIESIDLVLFFLILFFGMLLIWIYFHCGNCRQFDRQPYMRIRDSEDHWFEEIEESGGHQRRQTDSGELCVESEQNGDENLAQNRRRAATEPVNFIPSSR